MVTMRLTDCIIIFYMLWIEDKNSKKKITVR